VDKEIDSLTKYASQIDLIFLIIYTCEMILKIIAMGFFMRAHSYLRDSWNIVSATKFIYISLQLTNVSYFIDIA